METLTHRNLIELPRYPYIMAPLLSSLRSAAASQNLQGVSLRDLWEFGQSKDVDMKETLKQAAQFLHVQVGGCGCGCVGVCV